MYTDEQIALFKKHKPIIVSLFELQFASETMFLWNGISDRKFNGDNIYKGMWGRVEIPNVPQSRTAENAQETILISGMPPSFAALLNDNQNEVNGRTLIQREQYLDPSTNQPVGPASVEQIYIMRGTVSMVDGGTISGTAPNSTIGIKIETLFGSRSEAGFGRYTSSDQAGRFPNDTDLIFTDVPSIASGRELAWP